jgi:hypothetical protein
MQQDQTLRRDTEALAYLEADVFDRVGRASTATSLHTITILSSGRSMRSNAQTPSAASATL